MLCNPNPFEVVWRVPSSRSILETCP